MALVECKECGKEISELAERCPNCGAYNGKSGTSLNGGISEEYTPISPWGYVGYQLLFSIPIIGLIVLCIYAFGNIENINLKNYAKSYFCIILVLIVLIMLLAMMIA